MLPQLHAIERRNPEWAPWLRVVAHVLGEVDGGEWDALVPPERTARESNVPLLAGATLSVEVGAINALFARLSSACAAARPEMRSLGAMRLTDAAARATFQAALDGDDRLLAQLAERDGASPAAFGAVATLLPMPFLHACRRQAGRAIAARWSAGYCPVCGAWPAFGELRGVERSRHLRCGRCGSGWEALSLCCVYCGMTDHEQLRSLVAERAKANCAIEVCQGCRGYLKTYTTLRGCTPAAVMLEDLAGVEYDLAAAARGYRRPAGTGYALRVTMADGGRFASS